MFKSIKSRLVVLALASALATSAHAGGGATGAGSSFVYPLMTKWTADYRTQTKNQINYQSIGSGGGIAQIKAATVDFGASDAPLKPEDLAKFGLGQFPAVIGGVVPVLNVPGVAPGKLRLTGALLADMFMGKIKLWNDPAIVAANPGLSLPALPIRIVHRADASGTTFNFVNYLSKVSPTWKTGIGEGTAVKWPTGIGGKGNEGVATYVKQLKGGLGYVELSYALQNKMSYAAMQNAAGNWITPSAESFAAAAASADWKNSKDFYLVITNAPGEQAWPISATVFMIMYKQPKNAAAAKTAKDFFAWAYANGDAQAKKLDYVPLPPALVQQIEQYWTANFKF